MPSMVLADGESAYPLLPAIFEYASSRKVCALNRSFVVSVSIVGFYPFSVERKKKRAAPNHQKEVHHDGACNHNDEDGTQSFKEIATPGCICVNGY
jgi:hypothetical protein